MSTPAARLADTARETLKTVMANSTTQGLRLTTWLMVGNAGALAFTFNAVTNGTGCPPALLRSASMAFAIGLILGFLGAAMSFMGSIINVKWAARSAAYSEHFAATEHLVQLARADGTPKAMIDQAHELHLKASESLKGHRFGRVRLVVPLTAGALVFGSACSFAWGMTEPLRLTDGAFQACATGKPDKALPMAIKKAS